jgi:Flp pilus assembly protein TadD
MAKVLIAEKQWAKALEHLEPAARLDPNDEAVQYNLMLTYRGLGRSAEAKQAFNAFQSLKQKKDKASVPVTTSPP